MNTQSSIIEKLDSFIRKYYKNKLLKGLIYTLLLVLVLFIFVVLLEHFGYFGTTVRTILFWFFILSALAISAVYIVSPLLKMFRLGKCISYEEAALIIGRFFPEVGDKLLNLLQLQQMGHNVDSFLLQASIDQKASLLSPIPFLNAINLKGNVKYLKYLALPVLFIAISLIIAPSLITEPSSRLINHSTYYEKPAPFSFILQNDSLVVQQQQDFQVRLMVEGNEIPADVSIVVDGSNYRMQKVDNTHYTYLFKNIQRSHQIQFASLGILSRPYDIVVVPRPAVLNFQILLSYPAYTAKEPETLLNIGDLSVPKGTLLQWVFQTKDADSLLFSASDRLSALSPSSNGRAKTSLRALSSFDYFFFVGNGSYGSDTLAYSVSVIDDAYPSISALQLHDSLMPDRVFFKGQLKDDYGFTKLLFLTEVSNVNDSSQHLVSRYDIPFSATTSQEFYYSFDFSTISLNPGDRVKYYFEVWDNDAINGPKSSKSQQFETAVPTEEEIDEIIRNASSDISSHAETALSDMQKIQNEINELMRSLVDKKELSWQDKQKLEELKKRHEEMKEQLSEMRQQIQENNRLEQKYREQSEQLLEKQKELDELLDKVMNDELKELMKEMDKLMNELDKKKVQQELENLKMKNEDIEKQLDQNIELMKRLELEKRVEEAVNKADELSKKQQELSEKSAGKENTLQEQQKLSEQFKQLENELDKIQQDYKKLDNPANFNLNKELQKKIENEQKDAENKLSGGKNKDASKSQKSAADDMQELSEQIAQAQMDMEQQDLAEDSEQIRRLLKNIVQLSFNQEALISDINAVNVQDPKYQKIIYNQSRLKDDFRNVEDSLRAVAKRQVAVAAVINKELAAISSNISKSMSNLLQYNQSVYGSFRNTTPSQPMQYSMTSLNNLSLVLAESLDQMQNQMRQNQQQKKSGSCKRQGMKMKNQCSNPGSKPSPKSMRQMQEELNRQINSLKKQLEKQGNKPGRTQLGKQNSMSSEFAKMAAQQEQIRRMMQQYGQELKEQSGGNAKLAREIDDIMRQMEQTETDLVNKTITRQTIQRQQQIMTRLLQHEKADLQREKEERRQSTEGKDIYQPSPADLEQFEKMNKQNSDLFRSAPPSFNNYYKNKVNDYFFKF